VSGGSYGAFVGASRSFIVRISESPRRVVVEDVRERRRALAVDLRDVGAQIEAWLAGPPPDPGECPDPAREDSVSGQP
jgi:hypothetical protein